MRNIQWTLPPEQYGFRPGRGTSDAINELLQFVLPRLQQRKGKAYAAFVDFEKAFDSVDRSLLVDKLKTQFQVQGLTLRLIGSMLRYNKICVFDGLRTSAEILQHRGVLQGDSLSPTLFLAFIADLATSLRTIPSLRFLFYADDLVFFASEAETIKAGFQELNRWCLDNKLKVNVSKTKVLKFRKAGRLARDDRFTLGRKKIEICQSYEYLGVTLQPALCFTKHLQRRKAMALAAIGSLKGLALVSTATALKIFNMKIRPMLTYGWDSVSRLLPARLLIEADRVKTIFLKKALCLPKNASATLALHLCETPALIVELQAQGLQLDPTQWEQYLEHRGEREAAFTEKEFVNGPAFADPVWRRSHQKHRHAYTRSTAHGFHHRMCETRDFHSPAEGCVCRRCGGPASALLHMLQCPELAGLDLVERVKVLDDGLYTL